ncbi:MAG TPA: porin [Gammaproteobacteria bacterium]|nr:porin [Gammaproteobacteria bacterium]
MSFRKTGKASLLMAAALFYAMPPMAAGDDGDDASLRQRLDILEQRLEATAEMLEDQSRKEGHGTGGRTTLGGYGELHYRRLANQRQGGDDLEEMDLHRFILFLGHEFDDRIRFFSELEVEHALAGAGANGEVAMEQAYLEFDVHPGHVLRAGLLLIPAGIINETHEPPTFYGVERNPVETRIIPSTWREGGVALSGEPGSGWRYDLAVHSGLALASGDDYAIRKGRQDGGNARADDLAYTGRIQWLGLAGLELAATILYQADASQGEDPSVGDALMVEAHGSWRHGGLGLRALYARWRIDGDGPEKLGADRQDGWYVEPSYRFTSRAGVFLRYSVWDNQAGGGGGSEYGQIDAGVNYWPHPDVVVKVDYQDQDAPAGQDEFDGFNVGVGYQF